MPWVLDRAMKRHLFLLAALTAFSPVPSRAQSDDLAYCNTLYDLAVRYRGRQINGESKPDPDMVLKAMAETGMDAAATVVIGDTSFDMEMARSAGATAIGVAWGYHETAELAKAGAHAIIHQPADLLVELRRLAPAA